MEEKKKEIEEEKKEMPRSPLKHCCNRSALASAWMRKEAGTSTHCPPPSMASPI